MRSDSDPAPEIGTICFHQFGRRRSVTPLLAFQFLTEDCTRFMKETQHPLVKISISLSFSENPKGFEVPKTEEAVMGLSGMSLASIPRGREGTMSSPLCILPVPHSPHL